MRGPVARQAVQHLQAGRYQEALALLREHGKGSASLALLEHGYIEWSICLLKTCDAQIGDCPLLPEYDPATTTCPQMGPPRAEVGEPKLRKAG